MSRPWDPYAPPPAPAQRDPEPTGRGDDLDGLTKAELIERAKAAGLSRTGTRAELVERLRGR